MKKTTDIRSVRRRAVGVFLVLLAFLAAGVVSLWRDTKDRSTVQIMFARFRQSAEGTLKQLYDEASAPEPTPRTVNRVNIQINTSETVVTVAPTRSASRTIIRVITPTPIVYPTAAPGSPGSKEWEDNFWKTWNEMGAQNAAMQKQVEESQAQFCRDHPSLCN